jgi:hypothetical protein
MGKDVFARGVTRRMAFVDPTVNERTQGASFLLLLEFIVEI